MSNRSSRVSLSTHSKKEIKQFKFSNYQLSYLVRSKVYEKLISFDDNLNYEFEESQIKKALITLLESDQFELTYVTRNVFRYDKNNDGIVTYEQFTNFCLEQHFGQIAIQRLHKKGIYKNGSKRIMDFDEFQKTLLYCLSFISVQPSTSTLKQIFEDIDTERKGSITYSQYFIFLKEYFGSKSESAEAIQIEVVKQNLISKKQEKSKEKLHTEPTPSTKQILKTQQFQPDEVVNEQMKNVCERIARFVFHQLKITAMNFDFNKVLGIEEQSAISLITKHFKIDKQVCQKLLKQLKISHKPIQYQTILQSIVDTYMCHIIPLKLSFPLNQEEFIEETKNNMNFISAKPSTYLLEDAFRLGSKTQNMGKQEYIGLMGRIFGNYKWPRKTGQIKFRK